LNTKSNNTTDVFDIALENELAPYVKNFHLNELPFTTNVPGQHYYINPEHQQHLNHLTHLLQSSDLILVLSGEAGSGKSSLIQQLINRNIPGLDFCQIQANEQLHPAELLIQLTRCFELPEQLGIKASLDLLQDHANILRSNNRVPIAIIDDAHELPDESLKVLISLQQANEHSATDHWHIILATHPAYTADLLQLNDRLHFIHLNPLDIDQTRDYLHHRMQIAGFEGDSPFTEKDIDFIFQQSEGLPKRIHQLAHQVLMQKTPTVAPKQTTKHTQMPDRASLKHKGLISGIVIIFLILGSVLLFQDDINLLIDGQSLKKTKPAQESLPLPVIPPNKKDSYLLYKLPDPAPARPAVKQNPVSVVKKQVIIPDRKVVTKKTAIKAKVVKIPVTTTIAKKQSQPSHFEIKLKKHAIYTRTWIMQQTPAHFSAQIMASSHADSLIKQASLPELTGKSAIYSIIRNGKPWYVLLFGHKSDKLAIKTAIAGLPTRLQKNKPWIRSFAAIQADINAGKK